MTYFVNKTNGAAIVVPDGTKDTTSTSLTLLGKLSSNYGEDQNENFVRLLENFANGTSPANPITGQLWYDTANTIIKVYDSVTSTWQSVGSTIQGNLLIGGDDGFEIQKIGSNVNLINKGLNGNVAIFANISSVSTEVLNVEGSTGLITVAANATNNFGITTKVYVDSLVSSLQNSITNINSGNGSLTAKDFSLNGNVALNNSGTGNVAINLKTPGGVTIISAQGSNDAATPVTIKGQWVLGTNANIQANYADLAENFSSDKQYESGTVLVFGGTCEVTESTKENDEKVAGVVTTDPAFVMNFKLTGVKSCIALQGRVPCKVVGIIETGDMLVTSSVPGHAQKATNPKTGTVIGKALQNHNSLESGIIEILAGRT